MPSTASRSTRRIEGAGADESRCGRHPASPHRADPSLSRYLVPHSARADVLRGLGLVARPSLVLWALLLLVALSIVLAGTGGTPGPSSLPALRSQISAALQKTKEEARKTVGKVERAELPKLRSAAAAALQRTGFQTRAPVAPPGDSSNRSNWKVLGVEALVAWTLAAASAKPVEPPPPLPDRTPSILQQVNDLKTALANVQDTVKSDVAAIQGAVKFDLDGIKKDAAGTRAEAAATRAGVSAARTEIDALKTEIGLLRKKLDDQPRSAPPAPAAPPPDTGGLKQQIELLRKELEALRKAPPAPAAPAATAPPPTAIPVPPPTPAAGHVRLVNTFEAEQTILLNAKPYVLAPNDTRDVEVPAGPFTYQVVGVTAMRTRAVAPKGVFTIDVHAPRAEGRVSAP